MRLEPSVVLTRFALLQFVRLQFHQGVLRERAPEHDDSTGGLQRLCRRTQARAEGVEKGQGKELELEPS